MSERSINFTVECEEAGRGTVNVTCLPHNDHGEIAAALATGTRQLVKALLGGLAAKHIADPFDGPADLTLTISAEWKRANA